MKDEEFRGRVVFLTVYLEKWYRELNSEFNVPITARLAKVVKVFDWSTKEGKLLLAARKKNKKWSELDAQAFKFVLKIYYPDLVVKNSNEVMIEEVVPRYYPGTENEMFKIVPEWMVKDMAKDEKSSFSLVAKASGLEVVRKKTRKKTTKKKGTRKARNVSR